MSYECKIGWSDAGLSGSGDVEEGVILDVPSILFSSLYFLLYYILQSGPRTNGISIGFIHLRRYVKSR